MKGQLALKRVSITVDGEVVPGIIIQVRGNVGDESRKKLDVLGLAPVSDMANCRESAVLTTPEAINALRTALVEQGIVYGPDGR